jgi:dTDP-6-deoxy-L-talose 4-dehydrogenase (NAD+)
MKKKIMVTGATGFIGTYVVERLLEEGVEVIATSVHEEKARQQPWFSRVQYVPFDLATFDPQQDYYQFFGGPDAIIHLAWEGLPNYKSDFHLLVNYPRHAAFLRNLAEHGLKDITVTGSCMEYGMQEGEISEDQPALADHFYGRAKEALRLSLEQLAQEYGIPVKWARLFYMYGKGQSPKSLLSQLEKALETGETSFNMSGGEQVRDYMPVDRVADYIVRVALQDDITGTINVCSGKPISVKQLVEDYLRKTGRSIHLNLGFYPYTDYEPMSFWGNPSKMEAIVNHSKTHI